MYFYMHVIVFSCFVVCVIEEEVRKWAKELQHSGFDVPFGQARYSKRARKSQGKGSGPKSKPKKPAETEADVSEESDWGPPDVEDENALVEVPEEGPAAGPSSEARSSKEPCPGFLVVQPSTSCVVLMEWFSFLLE